MGKVLGFELEDIILLIIPVAKSSNNSASLSLYVMKIFDVTNPEKEYHE